MGGGARICRATEKIRGTSRHEWGPTLTTEKQWLISSTPQVMADLTRPYSHRGGSLDADVIGAEVANCDVLLAVIGPNWLNAKDEEGNSRLESEHDFVRIEIAAALKRHSGHPDSA
jgi:hypothetical protein